MDILRDRWPATAAEVGWSIAPPDAADPWDGRWYRQARRALLRLERAGRVVRDGRSAGAVLWAPSPEDRLEDG